MNSKSNISGELDSFAPSDGFDPVVHEIGHDEKVDDLGHHEPVAHVFGQQARGSASVVLVELCVSEHPEDQRQDS